MTQKQADIQQLLLLQEKQLQEIQDLQSHLPFIGPPTPLSTLHTEYEGNPGFQHKIEQIQQQYKQYRPIKRDGNCFYRAFLFCLYEKVIGKDKNVQKILLETFEKIPVDLKKAGFDDFVYQDSLQFMKDKLKSSGYNHLAWLEKLLNTVEDSNYMIMLLRFATSAQIKNNQFLYENYMDGTTVQHFCCSQVQPLDKEADQIMLIALSNFTKSCFQIVYLDCNPKLDILTVGQGTPLFSLLYRPGHYDIIY